MRARKGEKMSELQQRVKNFESLIHAVDPSFQLSFVLDHLPGILRIMAEQLETG